MPSRAEVSRQLGAMMDAMGIPPGPQRDAMRNLSVEMQWDIIQRNKYQRSKEMETPEACIRAVQEHPGDRTLRQLRVNLLSRPVTWITRFLECGGLDVLLATAQRSEMQVIASVKLTDAEQEDIDEEIVLCFKGVMNYRPGLSAVMRKPEVTRELIRYITSRNPKTQRTALELLACISIYPPNGHRLVMNALKRFKLIARRNGRFDVLIDVLQFNVLGRPPNAELGQWLLTLINAIVNCHENIEERIRYRQELANVGFNQILNQLSQLHYDKLDCQIQVYRENEYDDNEETEEMNKLFGGSGQDIDPQEICVAIFQQLLATGNDELVQGYVLMLREMLRFTISQRGQMAFLAIMHAVHGLTGLVSSADDVTFRETVKAVDELRYDRSDRTRKSIVGPGLFAPGPSPELDAVRDERASLQRQLDAARKTIAELRQRIAELEALLAGGSRPSTAGLPLLPSMLPSMSTTPRSSFSGMLPPMRFAQGPSSLQQVAFPSSTPPLPSMGLSSSGFSTPMLIPQPEGQMGIAMPTPLVSAPIPVAQAAPTAATPAQPGAAPTPGAAAAAPKPPQKAITSVADLFASRAPPVRAPAPAAQAAGVSAPAAPVRASGGGGGGAPGTQWGMHATAIPPPIMPEPGTICGKGPLPPPAEGTYGDDAGFCGNQSWGMHPSAIPPPIMPEPGSICGKGPLPPPAAGTYGDLCGGGQSWGMHPSAIPPPIMPEPGSICGKGPMPPPATGTYAGAARRGGGAARNRLPAKPNVKPPVMTKRLQWDKIEDNVAAETIWAQIGAQDLIIDQELLVELFGRVEKKPEEKPVEEKPKVVALLSNNASRAVAISQNQFKMDLETLVTELSNGNDELFDIAQLDGLIKLCQNEENPLGSVAAFTGDITTLGKTEQFCAALNRVPDLQKRLEVWLFRRQFNASVVEIQPDVEVVQLCFLYLRHSAKFRRMLQLTLSLGNFLNGGSRNGGAYGFRLQSLTRLQDTKDCRHQTLLHCLVRLMQRMDQCWANGELDDKGDPRAPDSPPAQPAAAPETAEDKEAAALRGRDAGLPDPYRDRDVLQNDGEVDAVAEVTKNIDALFPQLCFVREMVVFSRAEHISFQSILSEIQQLQAGFEKARKETEALPRAGAGAEAFFQRMDSFFASETATIEQLVKAAEQVEQLFRDVAVMYGEDIQKPDDAETLVATMREFRSQTLGAIRDIEQERINAEREAARKLKAEEQLRRREAAKERAASGKIGRRPAPGEHEASPEGDLMAQLAARQKRTARVVEAAPEEAHEAPPGDAGPTLVPAQGDDVKVLPTDATPSADQFASYSGVEGARFVPRGQSFAALAAQANEQAEDTGLLDNLLGQLTDGEAFRRKQRDSLPGGRRVVHAAPRT